MNVFKHIKVDCKSDILDNYGQQGRQNVNKIAQTSLFRFEH